MHRRIIVLVISLFLVVGIGVSWHLENLFFIGISLLLAFIYFLLEFFGNPYLLSFYEYFNEPDLPMAIKVQDGILCYGFKTSSRVHTYLQWKIKLDDIILITASEPSQYVLRSRTSILKRDRRMGKKRLSNSRIVKSYRYLHFFDQNRKQYLLDLFSHPEGMREAFDILEMKFGVNRNKVEDIAYHSRVLYPKVKRTKEPHIRVWLLDIQTIKMWFHKYFTFTHPKSGIVGSEILAFAEQEHLLSEIGSPQKT